MTDVTLHNATPRSRCRTSGRPRTSSGYAMLLVMLLAIVVAIFGATQIDRQCRASACR